jgi:hypothetical protein
MFYRLCRPYPLTHSHYEPRTPAGLHEQNIVGSSMWVAGSTAGSSGRNQRATGNSRRSSHTRRNTAERRRHGTPDGVTA